MCMLRFLKIPQDRILYKHILQSFSQNNCEVQLRSKDVINELLLKFKLNLSFLFL